MADSYIDLNVEHYLRNGELKGAVKDLNTIINGEGSNKSLTELVEDLKVALNYANWGYWGNWIGQEQREENIKPLKEAIKRVSRETEFMCFAEIPLIKGAGGYYYMDLDKAIKEMDAKRGAFSKIYDYTVEINVDLHGSGRWTNYLKPDFSTSNKRWEVSRYNFKKYDCFPKKVTYYANKKDIAESNGFYKVCTFSKDETPTDTIAIKLVSFRGKPSSGFNRGAKFDIETQKVVDDFD